MDRTNEGKELRATVGVAGLAAIAAAAIAVTGKLLFFGVLVMAAGALKVLSRENR